MRLEDLLTASATRTPEAIAAIEPDGKAISYKALEAYAAAVADALTKSGVSAGDRVGLCLHKNIAAFASLLGAMKAGAAYVPVDVSAPAARNGYIFNDCDVRALIVEQSAAAALHAELGGDGWDEIMFPAPPEFPSALTILVRRAAGRFPPSPELAYILYTSGSTGRPKGVTHSHATALAFVDWCSEEFNPTADDRFSSHAPFHFDLSILDIYVPLKHGASVVVINSEAGKQPGVLADLISRLNITIWYSTPSILRMLLEYGQIEARDCSALRIVNFAGEVFPIKHLRALMAAWPHPIYYNLYGPTETNVCTYFKLPQTLPADEGYALPIGHKCSGDELRIVELDGSDANPGEEGELVVTGGSVMLGYWNLPERNAEAYLKHDGKLWYKTGDVVRDRGDGELLFSGRRDRMIKRRGFRVELGEIEAALLRHSAIPEAAVIARPKEDGDLEVVAFLAWAEDKPASTLKLKQFCSQQLPLYMVPDRFVTLPELPKTSTDKLDYQRLKDLA